MQGESGRWEKGRRGLGEANIWRGRVDRKRKISVREGGERKG